MRGIEPASEGVDGRRRDLADELRAELVDDALEVARVGWFGGVEDDQLGEGQDCAGAEEMVTTLPLFLCRDRVPCASFRRCSRAAPVVFRDRSAVVFDPAFDPPDGASLVRGEGHVFCRSPLA